YLPCLICCGLALLSSLSLAAQPDSLRLNAVIVLKGNRTVIADDARTTINTTGNPALATAGSGDVLTGLIASLIAQGMTAYDAARLGVSAHGLAADRWAKQHGRRGLRAIELADRLPSALG
ncbi:MAG: NAD(P)H-hydrate dehydratase, partial [Phycisphaeraceae bacterium]